MTLKLSDELSNLESLGLLEVRKESFVVSMDLCVIFELAFNEVSKVFAEFIDGSLVWFSIDQAIPMINISWVLQDEIKGSKQLGTCIPFHGDCCSFEVVEAVK